MKCKATRRQTSAPPPPQDIFKQATEDRLTSAKELPYFEGDFWPNVLEESIKELEQEEEERKREENSTSNESTDVSSRMLVSIKRCQDARNRAGSSTSAGHEGRQQERQEEEQQKDEQEQEQLEPSQ